jgi:hypothetical protein
LHVVSKKEEEEKANTIQPLFLEFFSHSVTPFNDYYMTLISAKKIIKVHIQLRYLLTYFASYTYKFPHYYVNINFDNIMIKYSLLNLILTNFVGCAPRDEF